MEELDKDIISWIMEHLLRQKQVQDPLITSIIANPRIPFDIHNLRLKKTLLLRSLLSHLSDGCVPETLLDLLQAIAQLDCKHSIPIPNSMKAAYCGVALECTAKYLWGDLGGKFSEAVERIWRLRIGNLEGELVTPELLNRKQEMEAALSDSSQRNEFMEMNTRNDALLLIGDYVTEALASMGPSFLECAATQKKLEQSSSSSHHKEMEWKTRDQQVPTSALPNSKTQRMIVPQKPMWAAKCRRTKGPARIADSDEPNFEVTSSKAYTLPTPEVKQAKEMLKSSLVDLRPAADDLLPYDLRVLDTVIAEIKGKNLNQGTLVEKQNGIGIYAFNTSTDAETMKVASQMESDDPAAVNMEGKNLLGHEKDVKESSLVNGNSSARAHEWDCLVDDSPGDRVNSAIRLDSPKRREVSPLRKYEIPSFGKRRRKKRWSVEEEDALREGVQKYGKGNWKLILSSKRDIFSERTEVDLKDKWRNMVK